MQFVSDLLSKILLYSVILFYYGRVRSTRAKVYENQTIEYNEHDTMDVSITLKNTTNYKDAILIYSNENNSTNFNFNLHLFSVYNGSTLYVAIIFEDNKNITKPVFQLKLVTDRIKDRHVCLQSCEIIIAVDRSQDKEIIHDRKIDMRSLCVPSCGPNAECRSIGNTFSCSCYSNFTGTPPNCYQLSNQSERSPNAASANDRVCIGSECEDHFVADSKPHHIAIYLTTALIAIIVCGFLIHFTIRRRIRFRNVSKEDNTYNYVTQNQLFYADLDVGLSKSNNLPTANQILYTHVIGVLKEK
ncbi:uncharacterized protein LOC126778728 [Nymphalis io]|uniref:uncharacterized protein LOC126778728 n=1 Tax=Inachis io TaxID=171585 RepID=UPI0021676258|nr:uncharacterized protein LOC126778728 [Nymphalis io]